MIYDALSAEYYDLVKPKVFSEELEFYQDQLKGIKGPVLDMMCGSGRLLLPLLQAGFDMQGVDYSQPMLDRCRQQGELMGFNPILYNQSVDTMSFSQKYEIIIISGGSFQLIYPRETAIRALHAAKNNLIKGGRLFIDIFIPWELLYENGEKEQFKHSVEAADGSIITLNSSSQANKYKQYFISNNKYEKHKNGEVLFFEEEEMPVLWYFYQEMTLLLQSIGFTAVVLHNKVIGKDPELTIYEAVS